VRQSLYLKKSESVSAAVEINIEVSEREGQLGGGPARHIYNRKFHLNPKRHCFYFVLLSNTTLKGIVSRKFDMLLLVPLDR
jgi:hypothetical protein